MKNGLILACLLLGLGIDLHAQATAPVDTTVCDIVKKPQAFDGKMVRIKGTVIAGLDEFAIKDAADPNCGYQVDVIWLDYPAGTKGKAGPAAIVQVQPARNFTGKVSPPTRTPVTLDKSKDFKQFDSLLAQKHEKGADMCLGCTRYEVTATLIGRLDAVADATLQRDASGKIIGFGGFGNMNAYPARLVLQSVSDVTPKEIDFSKNDDATKGNPISGPELSSFDIYAAIAAAQRAANGVNAGPPKDAAVTAAGAFPKQGEHPNGVYVEFGSGNEASPKDEELGKNDSPDGILFNCTFSSDRLQGSSLTAAVLHLGEHIAELRTPSKANEGAPPIVFESDAWVVTTVTSVFSGVKFVSMPGGYLIWDSSWPVADRNDKMTNVLKDFLANEMQLSQ